MNTKTVSIIIIILCFLSVVVGVINTSVKPNDKQKASITSSFFSDIKTNNDKIALITLQGAISNDSSDSFFGESGSAENVLKALEKTLNDKSVKGVILRVNSPGGTVALSQEIFNIILKLREEKPVVVSMADVAASGGYYISSAANRIYANPGTLTGSIGVIMEAVNAQELMTNKLGIKSIVIKSGKYKDTGSAFRPMRGEEKQLLQNLVDSTYNQFVNAIIKGRVDKKDIYETEKTTLTIVNLKKYADGRVLTGEQAKKLGFVDKLGGLYEAKTDIRKMAKKKFPSISKNIPVETYNKPSGFSEIFMGTAGAFFPAKNLNSYMPLGLNYPKQPLYMWE